MAWFLAERLTTKPMVCILTRPSFFLVYSLKCFLENSTSFCPTSTRDVCDFSTRSTMPGGGYYGTEVLSINCSVPITNIYGLLTVQKTLNATFAKQYNSFVPSLNQSNHETDSQIFYVWTSPSTENHTTYTYDHYIEAQFNLQGINQTVANDTYFVSFQIA